MSLHDKEEIAALKEDIKEANALRTKLFQQLMEVNALCLSRGKSLEDKNLYIAQREEELRELRAMKVVFKLRGQALMSKDETIKSLRSEVSDLEVDRHSTNQIIKGKDSEIKMLQEKIITLRSSNGNEDLRENVCRLNMECKIKQDIIDLQQIQLTKLKDGMASAGDMIIKTFIDILESDK